MYRGSTIYVVSESLSERIVKREVARERRKGDSEAIEHIVGSWDGVHLLP